MKHWIMALGLALSLSALDADAARRMGGGKSIGKQSSQVTQREQTMNPAQNSPQAAPATNTANPSNNVSAAKAPTGAASAAVKPKTPWGGILGGLAAGLGLAWLASSLGMGEGFGQLMLLLLVAMLGLMAWRFWKARSAMSAAGGLAMQGAGMGATNRLNPQDLSTQAKHYNPVNVGNDASARPWETGQDVGQMSASRANVLSGDQTWGIPDGFDVAGFVESAKRSFVRLQKAWDEGDINTLRALMTDEMLSQVQHQLRERSHAGQVLPQKTEVIKLDAQLLGIEDLGQDYMASVEFSGLVSESAFAAPDALREVWNMTKAKDGKTGWLVAGVQNFNA